MIPGASGDGVRHSLDREARTRMLDHLTQALASAQGVRTVWVYGSFVRDEPFRDLDLGVLLVDPANWRALAGVEEAVAKAIGDVIHLDIVPLNDATPAFKRHVVAEGRAVFEREPGDALDFAVSATSEAIDFADWQRAHRIGGR